MALVARESFMIQSHVLYQCTLPWWLQAKQSLEGQSSEANIRDPVVILAVRVSLVPSMRYIVRVNASTRVTCCTGLVNDAVRVLVTTKGA